MIICELELSSKLWMSKRQRHAHRSYGNPGQRPQPNRR